MPLLFHFQNDKNLQGKFSIVVNSSTMRKRSTSDLTVKQKWAIIAKLNLYTRECDRKVDYGTLGDVAEFFEIHKSHVSHIKRQYWDAIDAGEIYPNLQPHKNGRVSTKSELTKEIEKNIAKLNRKTKGKLGIRELAHAYEEEYGIKMPKSTMHRYCFLIGMYNVDSYLKPHLTIKQMINRVKFVLALLRNHNQSVSTFGDQNLTIDIGEKWFYVVPMKRTIRMCPEDEYPGDDTAQHKSHIPKIMFLAAIGKPHTLPDGTQFNGKIGIWPFIENVEERV